MSGSNASASIDQPGSPDRRRELVVSVNWIGDAIMAMPALQHYRRLHPDHFLAVLARGVVADLWKLHAAPDDVIRFDQRPGMFSPLFSEVKQHAFHQAWILPNSFRSAWMAFRSGIPRRTGVPGGFRRLLLNDVRSGDLSPLRKHQAWEYIQLMTPDVSLEKLPRPEIAIPDNVRREARAKHAAWKDPAIGMIPGAARGPSKRWPSGHFCTLARRFVRDGFQVILFGGGDDAELCREIVHDAGGGVVSLAGKTTLAEWAALMNDTQLVVANDSGGMHLAAALGKPVVALYGLTDPERTGPLGDSCRVIQHSRRRSRDIARNSSEAQQSLASIRPEEVYEAAQTLMRSSGLSIPVTS